MQDKLSSYASLLTRRETTSIALLPVSLSNATPLLEATVANTISGGRTHHHVDAVKHRHVLDHHQDGLAAHHLRGGGHGRSDRKGVTPGR